MRTALLALLPVLALATVAAADTTRPAYLGLTETGPGRFDIVWRVPRRGDRVLAISARLPGVFHETSTPTVEFAPGVQTTRWTVEAKPWELPGAAIVIEGPGAARVDTMVRFEFRDGAIVVRILPPGTPTCNFPRREAERSTARKLQAAALEGLRHPLASGTHVVFLLGLALCCGVRLVPATLAFFLLGQFAGLALPSSVPAPVAHALLAVAGVIGARVAIGPERRRLGVIASICGLAHGAALAAGGPSGPGDLLALLGMSVGIDAASLSFAVVAGAVFHSRLRLRLHPRVRTLACYGVGTAAVAIAMMEATTPGPALARDAGESVLVAPAASRGTTPSAAPVAPSTDAPVQLFVEITPFETRVEWVARVAVLGVADGEEIAVPEQEDVKRRVGALFDARLAVRLDGQLAVAAEQRTDFVTREANGVLERVKPVVEQVEDALVGIVHSFPTREPPGRVVIRWQPLPGVESIPAIIVDPKSTRSATLSSQTPELAWDNALAMPPVRAVAVRKPVVDLSLLSIGLLALALVAAIRRFGRGGVAAARVLLAGSFLLAPYAQVSLPMPGRPAPSADQAAEVVEALLTNVYRSLEQQDESAAYDRLGVSITNSALPAIYLDQRRMLELGRRGGARARVDSVEVARVERIEKLDGGRIRGVVAWDVGGFVVHFGHRHFRQNSYEAEVELVPEDGAWKIGRLEVLDKKRTR